MGERPRIAHDDSNWDASVSGQRVCRGYAVLWCVQDSSWAGRGCFPQLDLAAQEMDDAPAVERKAPDDRIIIEVKPSPNFDLESYISNYSGRCVLFSRAVLCRFLLLAPRT